MTKDEFFALPAKEACLLAYKQLKEGKIDHIKFDDILRAWWRNNHGKTDLTLHDMVTTTEDLFNG